KDALAPLFNRLGIEFGKQAILFDKEAEALGDDSGEEFGTGGPIVLPAIVFPGGSDVTKANPVAAAFRATAKAVDAQLDVRRSGFTPVYLNPKVAARLAFSAEIAKTTKECWNEANAVPTNNSLPKFDAAKLDDPKRGTPDEERRGPFTVGVAIETPIPAEWRNPALGAKFAAAQAAAAAAGTLMAATNEAIDIDAATHNPLRAKEQPTVRVVAMGNGGLFVGNTLDPARETLLLHTIHWQLKRDDRLPLDKSDAEKWRFPRVELSPERFALWRWGTFLGLPILAVYFGVLVLLRRNHR
ncbi:MAG: hypothetical protein ACRCZF_05665, partial [Gemmataceae bacterium]